MITPDYIDVDQLDSTIYIFYDNALALIKLRKQEAFRLSKVPIKQVKSQQDASNE